MCCCSSSFHSATFFVPSSFFFFRFVLFLLLFCHGEGALPLNCNAKIKAWVEEGNICTSCKLRKGKSYPSCFHVWCQWGVHVDHCQLFGAFGGPASFCIVLCGIHCLDHAGCQGCCCDTNDIRDTSVPLRYFESLGH